MREAVHCKDDWEVQNSEDEDNGALQYKVWKPGRLQLKSDEVDKDNVDNDKLKFGIPEGMKIKDT